MVRATRSGMNKGRGAKAAGPDSSANPAAAPKGIGGLPLPSSSAATNLVIADIVLRAAGGLLRNRMEKGLLNASYDKTKAERLVDGRGLVSSVALWSASRLATRSPLGLAVVAGGLAAKALYDRGKQIEAKRRAGKRSGKTLRSKRSDPQP